MDKILLRTSIKNQQILKPLYIFSILSGCNMSGELKRRDPLKIITLMVALLSLVSLAAQYNFIWVHRHKSLLFYTDAICTSLQGVVSLTKFLHLVLMHSQMFNMLQKVQNSDILRDLVLYELDLLNKHKILSDIEEVLNKSWIDIKTQLNFFFIADFGICSWYLSFGIIVDVYKTYINPQKFELIYPFPARFPMWHDHGMQFPYFYIEYMIVTAEIYLCGVSAVLFTGIFVVLTVHGLALMKILRKLISFTTNDDCVSTKERLAYYKSCIVLHQRIYRYCEDLNSIYRIESVPYFMVMMLVNCLIIFQVSLAKSADVDLILRAFLYLSAAIFEVAIFCFNGQRLTTESDRLPFTIYDIQWYNESLEFKRLTRMMIMRANRVVELTIGGFATFSLVTLMSIMRSSGSYFVILRNVNDAN